MNVEQLRIGVDVHRQVDVAVTHRILSRARSDSRSASSSSVFSPASIRSACSSVSRRYLRSHHWSNRKYETMDDLFDAAWRAICLDPTIIRTGLPRALRRNSQVIHGISITRPP